MLEYQLDQIKIVNFLLIDNFWPRELFSAHPLPVCLFSFFANLSKKCTRIDTVRPKCCCIYMSQVFGGKILDSKHTRTETEADRRARISSALARAIRQRRATALRPPMAMHLLGNTFLVLNFLQKIEHGGSNLLAFTSPLLSRHVGRILNLRRLSLQK